MLVIPMHRPVIEGLNSYYLNVQRFFEHHQRELGTFGIHMKSPLVEGIVYFDSGHFLSAICQANGDTLSGEEAINRLMTAVEKYNFSVSVYQIEPEMLFFWENALHAKPLHRGLTTDITDLDRLIVRMINQQLTGFIEVIIGDGAASGLLFFNSGKIVSASSNSGKKRESIAMVQKHLIEETNAKGGTFHVSAISTRTKNDGNPPKKTHLSAGLVDPDRAHQSEDIDKTINLIPLLEEVLSLCESVCTESKRVKDFQVGFRKAAIELAEKYSFLDPFQKEFEYAGGKVQLEVDVEPKALVGGVLECIHVMLSPLGLTNRFKEEAEGWFRANGEILQRLGLK